MSAFASPSRVVRSCYPATRKRFGARVWSGSSYRRSMAWWARSIRSARETASSCAETGSGRQRSPRATSGRFVLLSALTVSCPWLMSQACSVRFASSSGTDWQRSGTDLPKHAIPNSLRALNVKKAGGHNCWLARSPSDHRSLGAGQVNAGRSAISRPYANIVSCSTQFSVLTLPLSPKKC